MLDIPIYDAIRRQGGMQLRLDGYSVSSDDIVPLNVQHLWPVVKAVGPIAAPPAFPTLLYEWQYVHNQRLGQAILSHNVPGGRDLWWLYTSESRRVRIAGALSAIDDASGDAAGVDITGSARLIGYDEEALEQMTQLLEFIRFADTLIQCKNVKLIDRQPDYNRQQWRNRKRQGVEPYTFKVIQIDPQRTTTVDRGADHKGPSGLTPLHIVRGNFATYTEDRPLFGRYTGTFWRPAHVRGSAEGGVIEHAYEVKAPE